MDFKSHVFVFEEAWKRFTKKSKLYREEIVKGILNADKPWYKVRTHYYNPITRKGLWFFDNAKEKGMKCFKKAYRFYKAGKYKESSFYLGLAIHFVSDLAVPAHTKDSLHLWDCDDHENFLEENLNVIKFKKPIEVFKKRLDDFFEDISMVTNKFKCETNSWWVGLKYKLFRKKKRVLDEKVLKKQSAMILHYSVSYVLGLLKYFERKVEKGN